MEVREAHQVTGRTLERLVPRLTLEELEGRTQYRTPGPWRVAPTSDYPPGEKPGINIDAGEHGADGFICEVCGPNPDEQMRADAYFIAHAPDLLAIAQGQREELARLKARYAWIDSGFGDLDFHREEAKHKGPKRGCKASYYWMRIGVKMVTGGRRLIKSDDAKDAEPVADGIHSPYFDDDWRG